MKKFNKSNIVLSFLLLGIIAFLGCSKDDGPIQKDVLDHIDAVPAITINIDPSGSQSIDLTNLNSFQGKFTVSQYFAGSKPPEKLDIVVRRTSGGVTTVKIFKAGVTSLPASYTVSAADISGLFGTILLGDTYDFSADIYANGGKKYEAFPAVGNGTASGPTAMPGYSAFARYGAICAYNPAIYQGNFVVLQDDWADYSVGAVIQVTQVSATQFSFKYLADNAKPIIVTVNTGNNVTSVAKQVYGDGYGGASWTYGPISCQSVAGSSDNYVAPCDGIFSIKLTHTVAAGSFGDAVFKARKQ